MIGNTTARDAQPQPLSPAEYNKVLVKIGELKDERTVHASFDYNVGDSVKIITGPFSGFKGVISEILSQHNKLKVTVEIFGRPTLVEVDAMATEKNI